MRRIRQGVATEAYLTSTVREPPHYRTTCAPLGYPLTADAISFARHEGHNSAGEGSDGHGWPSAAEGMDARERPALECNRIHETQH